MKFINYIIVFLSVVSLSFVSAEACTSMLVSAELSGTGRPLMWKHRDTGTEHNFVERVPARNGMLGYVALFDGGDTELKQAWMGMNDSGFAILNTASYNVQPDTAKIKDNEGYLMTIALQTCRSVNDFEKILKTLRKPLGVQANFGVMDATGNLAYFEVNDHTYKRFDVKDAPEGYLIRTNFSMSGENGGGYGYIRYANVTDLLKPEIETKSITPQTFTEKASRSFWHSLIKKDFAEDTCQWVVDQDFIPRRSSTASIVIEGVNPNEPVSDMVMWTALGYPPCSFVQPVTLSSVPESLRPIAEGFRSPFNNSVLELKRKAFPLNIGNGKQYIDMNFLRKIMPKCHENSLKFYQSLRQNNIQN